MFMLSEFCPMSYAYMLITDGAIKSLSLLELDPNITATCSINYPTLSRFAFFPENNYNQKLQASRENWRKQTASDTAENLYQDSVEGNE